MRQYLTVALLAVCSTLLTINLMVQLTDNGSPVAHGQGQPSSNLLMAACSTQNDAFCFVYNPATKQLVSYVSRSVGGLELKGIRLCAHDFNPIFEEFPRSKRKTSPGRMKELASKARKKK